MGTDRPENPQRELLEPLVLTACRRALAGPADGGALYAARDLYGEVSSLPATGYRHAARETVSS
jgi:hypothetical protein